jgi:hypothetical protein
LPQAEEVYFPEHAFNAKSLKGSGGVYNSKNINVYHYAAQNPVKYVDPDGKAIETAWDVFNIGIGVHSLVNNIKDGNYGSASLDAVGILVDTAAAIVPFVPGGVGTVIKVSRGTEKVVGEIHHIASNKAIKSGFTDAFKKIFDKAGMKLSDAANKVFLEGHKGGHTKKYKEFVLNYLEKATKGLEGTKAKEALTNALGELKEILKSNPKLPYE